MKRYLAIIASVVILLSACSVNKSNYKTLAFFFDGVPDPEKKVEARTNNNAGKGQAGNMAQVRTYKDHGPFAAKMCHACHQKGTNILILPVEKLCLNCHDLNIRKKYIHGPVAAGGCRFCHEPHGSSYPFYLVADSKTFCLNCHEKKAVMRNEVHQGIGDTACTSCHDAHSSDSRYMLK